MQPVFGDEAMIKPLRVAMILTSHGSMGANKPTGAWFEEIATPYYAFLQAGARVDIASIKGGSVPIDPRSRLERGKNPASVDRFLDDPTAMQKLQQSVSVETLKAADYDVAFLPGGHGTMWDL